MVVAAEGQETGQGEEEEEEEALTRALHLERREVGRGGCDGERGG